METLIGDTKDKEINIGIRVPLVLTKQSSEREGVCVYACVGVGVCWVEK